MYRIGQEEKDAVARVIDGKDFFKINNSYQESMHAEEDLRRIFGVEKSIIMTSGHAALTAALIGMGIGPGDEVIVPAYTYIATAMAVVGAGAIPVIAEVDETLTIDPVDVERKISTHTKAIIPVHIQGFPCDMDAIMAVANKHNIMVLEDACQADGGSFHGKRLGTIGTAGALSFNYYKVISCGEGGALLTNDNLVYERALIYHDSNAVLYFGSQLDNETCVPPFCGSEYRTNDITAAILREQLKRMDGILEDNRRIKNKMTEALSPYCTIVTSNDPEGDCATTLAIRFDSEEETRAFAERVDLPNRIPADTGKHIYKNWTAIMEKRGAFHPLMDPFKMEANKDIVPDYTPDMCPKTLDYLARTFYFDIHPDLTEEQVDEVIAKIRAAL